MNHSFLTLISGLLIMTLLQSCGLFGNKGTASEKLNRRGEVTGVPKRSGWQQSLPFEMVPIKAGTFWMGQADEDIGVSRSSTNKQVTISEFFMDKYEVSNNKYRQFLDAVRMGELALGTPTTQANPPEFVLEELLPDTTIWSQSFTHHYGDPLMEYYFDHPAFDDYPVVGVSWDQAKQFCEWKSYHMNANDDSEFDMPKFRLPLEAEWEYASKGGKDIAKYPWGGPYLKNRRGCLMANFKPGRGNYIDDGFAYTAPVDAFAPNGYGLYNMAGNVAEWVEDAYYPAANSLIWDMNPTYIDSTESRKVVRGGSWKDVGYFLETSSRNYEYQFVQTAHIGFRTSMTYIGRSGSMNVNSNKRSRR